jgi:hypothetical protein
LFGKARILLFERVARSTDPRPAPRSEGDPLETDSRFAASGRLIQKTLRLALARSKKATMLAAAYAALEEAEVTASRPAALGEAKGIKTLERHTPLSGIMSLWLLLGFLASVVGFSLRSADSRRQPQEQEYSRSHSTDYRPSYDSLSGSQKQDTRTPLSG